MMIRIGRLIRLDKFKNEAQIRRNHNLYQSISTSTHPTRRELIDLNSASPNTPTKQLILRGRGSERRAEDDKGEGDEGEGDDIYDQSKNRLSPQASFGSTRIPIVRLPEDLIDSAQELLDSITNRSTIRTSALGLYSKYRLTSSKESLELDQKEILIKYLDSLQNQAIKDSELKKKNSYNDDGEDKGKREKREKDKPIIKPKLNTRYDHLTSISFLAGAMPSIYGSTLRVFLETKRRLTAEASLSERNIGQDQVWEPKSILDYGSGTGSSAWAALQVWQESLKEYVGLDRSSSMNWLNELMLSARKPSDNFVINTDNNSSQGNLKLDFQRISICPPKPQRKNHESYNLTSDKLASSSKINQDFYELESEQSSGIPIFEWRGETDGLMAVMSYTLSDLPNHISRKEAVLNLWNSGAQLMVIIDRGTPAGFQIVAEARQQLLMLGRRSIKNRREELSDLLTINDQKSSFLTTSTNTKVAKKDCDENQRNCPNDELIGSYVLAPCPHDRDCPLHMSSNPKHFCHFSQRIERPKFLKDTKHTRKVEEDSKYSYVVIKRGQRPNSGSKEEEKDNQKEERSCENEEEREMMSIKRRSFEWPRIILPPKKCKGEIERVTVPKSQGKQDFYDARKSVWGDSWPNGSKKAGIVKKIT
ncbi:mitochondrial small ribosomal subunit Rsm22-domain-containing protein [Phakopsora pachyrhizi]|uniref:Mitochondrial small ribosomal subunit Rsm22-domain-containing protein n=1 Tax=Phakopsora pachyrhizi TaxID=170000 RepID=A0AAV0BSW2_PHAPC|nr:mitochondrial small ribosomal subunit Rsm22-domain-containing protein [Phakopsora pachyrhizi]